MLDYEDLFFDELELDSQFDTYTTVTKCCQSCIC